jgi:AAA15 family ATPase/GTPase
MLDLILESDTGINDVIAEKGKMSENFPKEMPQDLKDFLLNQVKDDDEVVNLKTSHTQRNINGKSVSEKIFKLKDESEGTQKLILLSGPIIDVLINGKTLIIDEIEARLHTHLTRKLIKLFSSKETNKKNAQLIFATHDTNLLSNKLFRRDQIWFVEKDPFSASHLYSLAEIKITDGKVRNDASFEEDYLQGRYGAIPLLGELRQIFIDSAQEV